MARKKDNVVLVQIQIALRLPKGAKVDIDAHGRGSRLLINGETYCPQFALDPEHGEQVLVNDKQLASIGVEIVNYIEGECYITKE
jgi:hypothetical protein